MADEKTNSNIVPAPCRGVGPLYKPEQEKPTATVSKVVEYDNVHVLPQTPQLIALLTQVIALLFSLPLSPSPTLYPPLYLRFNETDILVHHEV